MTPSYHHAYLQANLCGELRKNEKYSIFSELCILVQDKEYIPDIAVYPKRKIHFGDDIIKVTETPLAIIEILSPTQGAQEIVDKFKAYFQAGVQSCWLVVPFPMSVVVYSAADQMKTFFQGEIVDEVLDIRIPMEKIFE